MLEKNQIYEGSSIGHCTGAQDGQGTGNCPEHMSTLFEQTLMVCASLGQEIQDLKNVALWDHFHLGNLGETH